MKRKKFLSLILCLSFCTVFFSVYSETENKNLSVDQVKEIVFESSKFYNPYVNKEEITRGCPSVSFKDYATKAMTILILSNGFGEIPEPIGNNLFIGNFGDNFIDVPDWAMFHVNKLKSLGILVGVDNQILGCNDYITIQELDLMIRRIWRIYGSNLKDDFYEYINKDWLDNVAIESGAFRNSSFDELEKKNYINFRKMIKDIVKNGEEKNKKEDAISVFYKNYMDIKSRNEDGIRPIKKNLDDIETVKTLEELIEVENNLRKETYTEAFFSFATYRDVTYCNILNNDEKKGREKVLYFESITPTISKSLFTMGEGKTNAYKNYLEKLIILTGKNEAIAKNFANLIFEMEKTVALSTSKDLEEIITKSDVSEIESIFGNVDLKKIAEKSGFELFDGRPLFVVNKKAVIQASKFIKEDNLELLKEYLKVKLLSGFGWTLSEDFVRLNEDFFNIIYGTHKRTTTKEAAVNSIMSLLPSYTNSLYVERYFPEKIKIEVEEMVKEINEALQERLKKVDWLTDETKNRAIRKLDMIGANVGYPDAWYDPLDGKKLHLFCEGGCLFENVAEIARTKFEIMVKEQSLPENLNSEFSEHANDVNAFYFPDVNGMIIPFGVLGKPFYDEKYTRTKKLSRIGTIIGHELSHAIDSSGAKYNEYGNKENWWNKEDYEKFKNKCDEVSKFYNDLEIIPGLKSCGELTRDENMADLGGFLSAFDVAKKDLNCDETVFFICYGKMWKSSTRRHAIIYIFEIDPHSYEKLRVNRTLQAIDEFYIVFKIIEGDGMYVPPEERVRVW
jgi:putative endopeptidase